MPVDPVINDHLGDVYWAVGREREAEFQWRRALSFLTEDDEDHEADPKRIRRKLEVGLDAVIEDEGGPSLAEKAAQAAEQRLKEAKALGKLEVLNHQKPSPFSKRDKNKSF